MNEALIQNAQHNVDDEYGDDQQHGESSEGSLELFYRALEGHADRLRDTQFFDGLIDTLRRFAQGDSRQQAEVYVDGRELAEVIDRQRADGAL